MKQFLYILSAILILSSNSYAQKEDSKKTSLHAGYGLFINYNLYSWLKKPSVTGYKGSSSGQVLNVLPGLGLSFWLGDVDHWIVSVEGAVEFLPFALDINGYNGMGALSIPMLAKAQFPVAKQKSLWLMMHVGAGIQLLQTEIYAHPKDYVPFSSTLFGTIIGEVGFHVSAVGYKRQHIREVEFFVRGGAAPSGAISLNTGLRLTLMNKIGK